MKTLKDTEGVLDITNTERMKVCVCEKGEGGRGKGKEKREGKWWINVFEEGRKKRKMGKMHLSHFLSSYTGCHGDTEYFRHGCPV